jgi:hypothetical protein
MQIPAKLGYLYDSFSVALILNGGVAFSFFLFLIGGDTGKRIRRGNPGQRGSGRELV